MSQREERVKGVQLSKAGTSIWEPIERRPNNKIAEGSCCLTKSARGGAIYIKHTVSDSQQNLLLGNIFFYQIAIQLSPQMQFNPLHLHLDSQETQYQITERAPEQAKYCPAHT